LTLELTLFNVAMEVFKTVKSLQDSLSGIWESKSLGLVPTMGALHEGHLSIVKRAKSECDLCLATIFVNPTQFDKKEDLDNYPNTLEEDLKALEESGCDYVFTPSPEEVYPKNLVSDKFEFDGLDHVMEGKFRPGHFDGVATIVKKLFEIIKPDKAYFGEKDFQQLQIIKKMVEQEHLPIDIVPCPTFREPDGLAMSSRNLRLTQEQRAAAPMIYEVLTRCKQLFPYNDPKSIKNFVKNEFDKSDILDLEYFDIADNQTLVTSDKFTPNTSYQAFIAVFAGSIRLIDNISLN